jgi:hypothetical protein
MITSDLNSDMRRPARLAALSYYRPFPKEVMAAAARAGVSLSPSGTEASVSFSRYEFPGDLTNDRAYRSSVSVL